MRILLAIALGLALIVTVFAVQNNQVATISFLFWSIEGSLALVLMLTLILGIIIGILLMIPGSVRNRMLVGSLRREVQTVRGERDSLAVSPLEPEPAEDRPEESTNLS